MKTRKTLLTALVLGAMTVPSVFATTTALPENASDQYARTTYFGKGNTTEDTTLTERSTVIGSLNTIKRATDMTTVIGDSNSVDGKNNTVIGSINIVQGHDSVVIGAGAQAGASVVPDGDDAPLLTLGSAEGHGVTVIGTNAWANTEYASAIGYAAQSLGKNSIALGSYSAAGDNTVVTSTGHDYKVAVSKTLTDMNSATFGSGDTRNAIDKGGVRVFNGSVNTGVTSNGMTIENTDTLEQASYTGSGM